MISNVNEYINNGYQGWFVIFISLLSICLGVCIITAKNPVVSVLFLIGLFVTISLYLILLGLNFIALAYLLVYVGAVSILFLFILMLINVRVSELVTEGKNSLPLAIISVLSFNTGVSNVLPYCAYVYDMFNSYMTYLSQYAYNYMLLAFSANVSAYSEIYFTSPKIGNVTSKSWEGSLIESNHISTIGNILYTNLFILLIITSLILLLAMIGTIVVTGKKKSTVNG